MSEPILLTVFRREQKLFVSPSVLSDTGFDSLPGILPVDAPGDLERALEAGAREAHAAIRRPPNERFQPGVPFWEAAGAPSWEDFVPGTTAVAIIRDEEGTHLELEAPDALSQALIPMDLESDHPPDLPLPVVARAVLAMFEAADRTPPTRRRRVRSERAGG